MHNSSPLDSFLMESLQTAAASGPVQATCGLPGPGGTSDVLVEGQRVAEQRQAKSLSAPIGCMDRERGGVQSESSGNDRERLRKS